MHILDSEYSDGDGINSLVFGFFNKMKEHFEQYAKNNNAGRVIQKLRLNETT